MDDELMVPEKHWADRSPSELMFHCIDKFNKCEAKYVAVIHINEKGDVLIDSNMGNVFLKGLLVTANRMINKAMFESGSDED